ncbi:preprotein translocase subunit SecE [Deinococcus sp. HSC-46F16]|uniref:preprotein translocase subunit SecE n=1 Tax=Deinococcus sp. HSC-46F16 TaxID=2910968 RepID=UPI00209D3CD6|nr:preprotein translocase subunit SecE [Deinococcus sp. HSC-46F16]MCP2015846.1 preprotein translocase subunit SecE [Deinococcus sp. HSC-46F16]
MNLMQYLRDSRAELAKVTWPTRQGVIEGTQAVLIFVVALTLIVFAMDSLFGFLVRAALQ